MDQNGFHRLGFEAKRVVGWDNLHIKRQQRDFKSYYGMSARVLAEIWHLLTLPKSAKPVYLLVLFRWLKSYQSEDELRGEFGFSVNTINKWNEILVKMVAALRVIKIDPNWNDDSGLLLGRTVDGIHYPKEEPRPFSSSMKSHKLGGAGLTYEYVVDAHKAKLVWLNGPFPAGTNDKKMLRNHGLLDAIKVKQLADNSKYRIIADNGYFAEDLTPYVSFRNEFDPRDLAYFKDRALSRHERFNGLTTRFQVLRKPFRHDRGDNPGQLFPMHKACVEAICVTVQIELDFGEATLFDPYPT